MEGEYGPFLLKEPLIQIQVESRKYTFKMQIHNASLQCQNSNLSELLHGFNYSLKKKKKKMKYGF